MNGLANQLMLQRTLQRTLQITLGSALRSIYEVDQYPSMESMERGTFERTYLQIVLAGSELVFSASGGPDTFSI